jgi:hypothetical protein
VPDLVKALVSVDGQLRGAVLDPGDWISVYAGARRAKLVRLAASRYGAPWATAGTSALNCRGHRIAVAAEDRRVVLGAPDLSPGPGCPLLIAASGRALSAPVVIELRWSMGTVTSGWSAPR